jgi:HemY protein
VSDHWLPVSPVTGRLDAFEWRDPLAGVDHTGATIDAEQRALLDAPRAAPPPLAVPMPATEHTDAVVPTPTTDLHAPAAGKSDGSSTSATVDESDRPDASFPTSGKPNVGGGDEPAQTSEPALPHDEPRPPPVIALAHVPDDPGPESETPAEEPAVEPGSVAPPDGWSRFRARFR